MSDMQIRELERRAATGDPEADRLLQRARRRAPNERRLRELLGGDVEGNQGQVALERVRAGDSLEEALVAGLRARQRVPEVAQRLGLVPVDTAESVSTIQVEAHEYPVVVEEVRTIYAARDPGSLEHLTRFAAAARRGMGRGLPYLVTPGEDGAIQVLGVARATASQPHALVELATSSNSTDELMDLPPLTKVRLTSHGLRDE